MMSTYWLFTFTSYTYCQGTRDANRNDLRLLKFSLPCERWEAEALLRKQLIKEEIEFNSDSIECLTMLITNS